MSLALRPPGSGCCPAVSQDTDTRFGALTESRQRIWEAQARARPWLYTDVVQNLIVQRPEYTRARNHLLFFRIRW